MSPSHPPAAALSSRSFTLHDAQAVYRLAQHDSHLGRKVKEALDITDDAINRFGVEHVALSFNGGKDCTVLVHLLAASLFRSFSPSSFPSSSDSPPSTSNEPTPPPSGASPLPRIPTVYIRCPSPFPQVEAFVSLCVGWYNLELEAVEGGMKEGLQSYLDRQAERTGEGRAGREIKAVLVGVRRGDPHSATLTPLCPTDPSWPSFMRVHPILDWSYGDVWLFLRSTSLSLGAGDSEKGEGRGEPLEWCELYDYGYTSLGSTHNTFPNPLLRATTSDGHFTAKDGASSPLGGWKPAWELEDEGAERAGREPPPTLPRTSASTTSTTAPLPSGLPSLAPAVPTFSRKSTDPFSQAIDTSEEAQRLKREMEAFSG